MHRPSDSGTWKRTLSLLAAGLVLAACGEAPPPGGGSGTSGLGSISGTLHAGGTLGASNDEAPAAVLMRTATAMSSPCPPHPTPNHDSRRSRRRT